MSSRRFPRLMWADYDAAAPRGLKVAIYTTRAEQRGNRPDLRPIRVRVEEVTARANTQVTNSRTRKS